MKNKKFGPRSFYYENIARIPTKDTRPLRVGRSFHTDKDRFFRDLRDARDPDWRSVKTRGEVQKLFYDIIDPDSKSYRFLSWNMLFWEVDRFMALCEHFDGECFPFL